MKKRSSFFLEKLYEPYLRLAWCSGNDFCGVLQKPEKSINEKEGAVKVKASLSLTGIDATATIDGSEKNNVRSIRKEVIEIKMLCNLYLRVLEKDEEHDAERVNQLNELISHCISVLDIKTSSFSYRLKQALFFGLMPKGLYSSELSKALGRLKCCLDDFIQVLIIELD